MHFSPLAQSLGAVSILLASHASASPVTARSTYAVKECHPVPRGWTEVGAADKSETINLQFGLKQGNEGTIEQHLVEVSDPGHYRYGQHLSAEEINTIIEPSSETVNSVREWLLQNNVTSINFNTAKDWISIPVSIEDAERLLQTKYKVFMHNDGDTLVRAPEFSLPLHLHEHVDVVQPTNSFFRGMARPKPRAELVKRDSLHILDGEKHSISWWEKEGKAKYSVSLATNST